MKVIFLGTPAFGVKVLDALCHSSNEVVAVVCQPDRMNGRGNKITFCPVKQYALEHNLTLRQYEKINDHVDELVRFGADCMVTCAYGQILRQGVLSACKYGVINVHASLLPTYRGSSPVEWALINGEKEIGVTIMQTELGVDTGDMILRRSIIPDGEENAEEMLDKLSDVGADLLVEALVKIEKGEATFTKQDESKATKCRMFTKEDGLIDFTKSAEDVHNFIRGINPRPGAYTFGETGRIKVLRAVVDNEHSGKPGEVLVSDAKKGLVVACGKGAIKLTEIQGENSKPMSAESYLLGKKIQVGSIFH